MTTPTTKTTNTYINTHIGGPRGIYIAPSERYDPSRVYLRIDSTFENQDRAVDLLLTQSDTLRLISALVASLQESNDLNTTQGGRQ